MEINIPGNILLIGEYAITKQNGLGIAFAIDAFVSIKTSPSVKLEMSGKYGGRVYFWQEGAPSQDETVLIEAVFRQFKKYTSDDKERDRSVKLKIEIDSSSFYYPDGRKKGYGSSAAVCAGLAYILLKEILGREPNLEKDVLPFALKVHRDFQGGCGSGYDIAVSLFGGMGIFTGGECPTWKRILPKWIHNIYLLRGDERVASSGAVKKFENWEKKHPKDAERFFLLSNRFVSSFARATSLDEAGISFRTCRRLGKWLGKVLNIPAEGEQLSERLSEYSRAGCLTKALGAGCEIGIVVGDQVNGQNGLDKVNVVERGLLCTP